MPSLPINAGLDCFKRFVEIEGFGHVTFVFIDVLLG